MPSNNVVQSASGSDEDPVFIHVDSNEWHRMTNIDGDTLPFPCHLCGLWFAAESQVEEHRNGRRHLEKLRRKATGEEESRKEEEAGRESKARTGTSVEGHDSNPSSDTDSVEKVTLRTTKAWLEKHGKRARRMWVEMGAPKYIMAPMVKQSELPFRILCRRYNVGLCYTPMIRARRFALAPNERVRARILKLIEHVIEPNDGKECSLDRPLVVQFCATDPESFCAAAKLVQDKCDAVDLNLGCPQKSAWHGGFGAFMMDKPGLVSSIVKKAANELKVPIWCKIRMLPTREATVKFGRMLEASGCSLLAVHARQRERSHHSGKADWDVIRDLKKALRIPVLANGNIQCLEDAKACLEYTNADGVMSAQGLLANPRLFAGFGCPGNKNPQKTSGSTAVEANDRKVLSEISPEVSSAHCWGKTTGLSGENLERVLARNRCSGGCLLTTKDRIEFCREYISVFTKFPDRMRYLGDHIVSFFRADPRLQARKEKGNVDLYSLLINSKRTTNPTQVLEILHCWEHRLGICSCLKGPKSRKEIISMVEEASSSDEDGGLNTDDEEHDRSDDDDDIAVPALKISVADESY
eukprot:CAMPEP_0114538640 /NCGR_PEP_ID=MMETSP0109-20121206/30252_1 /TAXON_ID=29199 /ORGANISM="Chlorarachnion reptans, Strain CCCM449" /LENGTH=581 /DNA_ID=CAMNT_0001722675 /DNA_START=196 /DNA_END=1939 /DNA_ORIENTATION=-